MRPLPLAVLVSFAFAAEAHHSRASFDLTVEVLVEGRSLDHVPSGGGPVGGVEGIFVTDRAGAGG